MISDSVKPARRDGREEVWPQENHKRLVYPAVDGDFVGAPADRCVNTDKPTHPLAKDGPRCWSAKMTGKQLAYAIAGRFGEHQFTCQNYSEVIWAWTARSNTGSQCE